MKRIVLVLFLGLAYALFVTVTGLSISCPFRAITGLRCPGCGITRACLALLRLDFISAFRYNMVLVPLLPVIALLLVKYEINGRTLAKIDNIILCVIIVILLIWGIIRNLGGGL